MKFLGHSFARGILLACVSLLFCTATASADYEQNFDSLADSGWTTKNLSTWTDLTQWRQAAFLSPTYYSAHSGELNSFVTGSAGADWSETNHLSDWLISPKFSTLSNGDVLSYFMLAAPFWFGHPGNDALELRIATGDECSPGTTAADVGDFTTRLLTIDAQAYEGPVTDGEIMSHYIKPRWNEHSAVIRGLPDGEHSGCVALRRTTPDTFWWVNMVGIDDFRLTEDAAAPGELTFLDNFGKGTDWGPHWVVRGRVDPGSTVSFFRNESCSGEPFTTASSDQFDWPGVSTFTWDKDVEQRVWASSTNEAGQTSGCTSDGLTYLWDTIAPTTSDDVGQAGNKYPGSVKLTALDSGRGVARTHFTIGSFPTQPTRTSPVYDAGAPPVLQPGERISYFSVDKVGNAEEVKTSEPAPSAPIDQPDPTGPAGPADPSPQPKGDVAASGARLGQVRPLSRSLELRKGKVAITLVCDGASGSRPCSGSVAIAAALGSRERIISRASSSYNILPGSRMVVRVSLTDAARRFAAKNLGRSPWAKVKVTPNGDATKSFRRKLLL